MFQTIVVCTHRGHVHGLLNMLHFCLYLLLAPLWYAEKRIKFLFLFPSSLFRVSRGGITEFELAHG